MSLFRLAVLPVTLRARSALLLSLAASGGTSSLAAQTARPDTSHGAGPHAMPGMRSSGTAHAKGPGMQAMMAGPLGLPMTRTGSGTAWVPDSTPMYARMFEAGPWGLMFHGVAFGQYGRQGGPRGASQLGSVNWGMLMAARSLGRATPDGGATGGRLQLRAMASLEPFTVGGRGYPLLLQTGEAYRGQPLHDRQHPHDLFMELAALYEKPLTRTLGLQLYAAPVGEPALGPVAFPHRPSASADPFATLGHHWEDATHISFGVLTAGLFTRAVKLEGSVFNGREPDEIRTNFDYKGRRLDSYAGRLSVNPSPFVSLSAAYGFLKSPEALHPEESVRRTTLSALYGRPFGTEGAFSASVLYGVNRHPGTEASPSGGVEALLAPDGRNSVFARVERSRKSAEELALPADGTTSGTGAGTAARTFALSRQFTVGSLSVGYVREVVRGVGLLRGASLGLGVEGTLNRVPTSLEPVYGSRTPRGFAVFLRLRPSRMAMDMGGMAMQMGAMGHGAARPTGPGARPMPMPMPGAPASADSAGRTTRAVPRAASRGRAAPAAPASSPAAPAPRTARPGPRPATPDSMPGTTPSTSHGHMPGMGPP